MNVRTMVPAVGGLIVVGAFACVGFAQQQGLTEKVGEKIDNVGRGIRREAQVVGEAVRKRFDVVRGDVQGMGVHPRVYSRLHWDRALNGSRIEVHMIRNGVVLLRGTVPDAAAREHAVTLTRETVGVTEVFDELVPLSAAATTTTRSR
jgi:osmotically-inducible protein OsmY